MRKGGISRYITPGNTRRYLAAAISLVTLVVYLPAIYNKFVEWDDVLYVVQNPHIRSFGSSFFRWAFFDFYVANWHPLTWISHALDYAIWGLNASGHHLTNILLHAANTFLVVMVAARLLEAWKRRAGAAPSAFPDEQGILIAAGITGVLFGLHPIHVESVAWVAERKDLLCALFYLLSVLSYISRKSYRTYLLSLLFFVLALLSKPMAVSLPAVLFILDWHPFERIFSLKTLLRSVIEKIPFAVLGLLSAYVTVLAQKAGAALVSPETLPLTVRLLVAARSLFLYLWKMLLPFNLVPFYPYPASPSLLAPDYLLPIVVAASFTAACLLLVKRGKTWLSLWVYYVITLTPVLGIIQVGSQSMADRYTYLPSLGPFLAAGIAAAWGYGKVSGSAQRRLKGRVALGVVASFLLICLVYLTLLQITVWKNSFTLWDNVIEQEPEAAIAYNGRAVAFYRIGEFDRAIDDLTRAIQLNPRLGSALYNMACIRSVQNRTDEACQWLNRSLKSGFWDRANIQEDPDLNNLRSAPCYKEIMAEQQQ